MSTGEWLSAPKGDFEQDTTLTVVEEEGRPNFFQQETTPIQQENQAILAFVSGVSAGGMVGKEPNDQHLPHTNSTCVGVRGSNGSSTTETSHSDSTRGTSPRKCGGLVQEESQLQNKGTACPLQIKLPFIVLTGSRWSAPSYFPKSLLYLIHLFQNMCTHKMGRALRSVWTCSFGWESRDTKHHAGCFSTSR